MGASNWPENSCNTVQVGHAPISSKQIIIVVILLYYFCSIWHHMQLFISEKKNSVVSNNIAFLLLREERDRNAMLIWVLMWHHKLCCCFAVVEYNRQTTRKRLRNEIFCLVSPSALMGKRKSPPKKLLHTCTHIYKCPKNEAPFRGLFTSLLEPRQQTFLYIAERHLWWLGMWRDGCRCYCWVENKTKTIYDISSKKAAQQWILLVY